MMQASPSTGQPLAPGAVARTRLRIGSFDIHKLAPSREDRLLLVLSIFIGIISGLLVVAFRVAIEWIKVLLLGSAPHPGQYRLIFMPAGMGLIVAMLVMWVFPGTRGSGVNQTKAALYVYNGYISFRTVIGKFITSALAIGSGHSLGPEDPSLQIGAGVASVIARRLKMSRQRLRLFAPIGAAAGLAAAFNAPITAMLFVIEEVIGSWSAAVLGSIVLAALSSVVVLRLFWGADPMFHIPTVELRDPRELLAYAVLGVVGGFVAVLFSMILGYLRPRLRSLPRWTLICQPVLAGLIVGAIGFLGFPQVMGTGYGVIDQAMHAQFTWHVLLALAILKLVATAVSFSSGTPGGMFAPTLFIGAMLGGAVGTVEKLLFPHLAGSVGSYALVGMGVLFAGFIRVPLTSVFMVLELSGNYSIITPVILANTIAYLISRSLQPVPIFEALAHQDGLHLPSMEEQREEVHLHIEDALRPADIPILQGSDTLAKASQTFTDNAANTLLVRMWGNTWYALTRDELHGIEALQSPETALETAVRKDRIPELYPDLSLDSALHCFARWKVLPIQNRAAQGALEGILTENDVLDRYHEN